MNWLEFKERIMTDRNYSQEDLNLLEKAYLWAEEIYANLKRKSGEPFINHCLRTALNLAEIGLDAKVIAAGILHDALEDGNLEEKVLKDEFGEEICFLVKGVTNIGHLKYRKKNLIQAENLKKLILYISKDIRVAIIKLADRLDNMRTLQYLPEEKQKEIALETEDIYAPLALRLGISEWAGELSDLAFQYLEPEKYHWLIEEVNQRAANAQEYLEKIKLTIEKEIQDKGIQLIKIESRVKRPSSIYKKLKRKNFDLDQIYDLLAFRIIVKTVEECYSVLGIIHSLFKPLIHEFDDYIAFPKPNGYRSLHTTVIGPEEKFIEFQIRTEEMHFYNEFGVAAYFAYADLKQTKNYLKERLVFASEDDLKIIQSLRENNQTNFLDFFKEKIYVFTPKGDIIELPAESTPLDFAYKIHTEIGNHFAGARVNNVIVPLDYKLNNGDVVEIITNKNRKPSLDWLKIVKSSEARKKIKDFLKKEKNIFTKEFRYELKVIARDRIGLLRDITNIISSRKINILSNKSKVKRDIASLSFVLQVNDKKEIDKLKELIKNKIEGVIEIK